MTIYAEKPFKAVHYKMCQKDQKLRITEHLKKKHHMDWIIRVLEHITTISKQTKPFLGRFRQFLGFNGSIWTFGEIQGLPMKQIYVLANKPTVHSGGNSRGRVCCLGYWHW